MRSIDQSINVKDWMQYNKVKKFNLVDVMHNYISSKDHGFHEKRESINTETNYFKRL